MSVRETGDLWETPIAEVTLTAINDEQEGEKYEFNERATCLVGRAEDCRLQLPDDDRHNAVSRYHCLLDINPPQVRVRDFGSKNGTYVNGEKIGQRERDQTPEEVANAEFPEVNLKAGDLLSLGETTFRVGIEFSLPEDRQTVGETRSISREELEKLTSPTEVLQSDEETVDKTVDTEPPDEFEMKVSQLLDEQPDLEFQEEEEEEEQNWWQRLKALVQNAFHKNESLEQFRDYKLEAGLGSGGFGKVYLARHRSKGNLVALKLLLPEVMATDRAIVRFFREVDNTKALDHPNILKLLDHGYANGIFFLGWEFCEEGTVEELVQAKGGSLSLEEALEITFQVLDALDYAHNAEIPYVKLQGGQVGQGKGLVHRDIKPSNLLLTRDGNRQVVKLTDFGLAKAFDFAGLSGLSVTQELIGTFGFTPRAQVVDFKYARPDVDVWATAATLYYLLTGTYPRELKNPSDLLGVLKTDPIPIRDRVPSLDSKVAEVIDIALQDNPEIHFKSAVALKEALQEASGQW